MKLPFEMISPGDNDCAVEAHENAQDDSQQNAPNHHQWPKKDGQASDWHANYFKGRAFTADEVVQQPLPAFEEHVGALDQGDPRLTTGEQQRYMTSHPANGKNNIQNEFTLCTQKSHFSLIFLNLPIAILISRKCRNVCCSTTMIVGFVQNMPQ